MGAAAVELCYIVAGRFEARIGSFYWSMGYRCRNNYSTNAEV